MAAEITITCTSCGFHVATWDDGAPYIQVTDGQRHYFFHPEAETRVAAIVTELLGRAPAAGEVDRILVEQAGNETQYVCRECLGITRRDPRRDPLVCSKCGAAALTDASQLAGQPCPSCKSGTMDNGRMTAVS